MYTIIVTDLNSDDPSSGSKTYQIERNTVTIGRSRANDIIIRKTNISSKHASISKTDNGFILKDLNSTNGIKVNKKRVDESIRIFTDDQIEIGGVIIRVVGHPDLERGESYPSMMNLEDNLSKVQSKKQEGINLDNLIPFSQGDSILGGGNLNSSPADDFSLSAIAPLSSDESRPSAALESPLPYHNSEVFKSKDPNLEGSNFNPFPIDEESGLDDSQYRNSTPSDVLLDKIKIIESKAIKKIEEKHASIQNSSQSRYHRDPNESPNPFTNPAKQTPMLNVENDIPHEYKSDKNEFNYKEPLPWPNDEQFKETHYSLNDDLVIVEIREPQNTNSANTTKRFAKQSIVIGRDAQCDICISNIFVSGRHAIIERQQGSLTIRDFGSKNGTIVNGRRINGTASISASDRVTFGPVQLVAYLSKDEKMSEKGQKYDKNRNIFSKKRQGFTDNAERNDVFKESEFKKYSLLNRRSYREDIDGNIYAITLQFYLARKAIGKALDEIQNIYGESDELRDICTIIAKSIRSLFQINATENNVDRLKDIVDKIIENLYLTLTKSYNIKNCTMVNRELVKAHSLLYPLSTDANMYFDNKGASVGLSVLAEIGYLGIRKVITCTTKEDLLLDNVDLEGMMIAGIRLNASLKYLSCARTLIKAITEVFFYDYIDSLKLVNLVDEACTNAIEHAFENQETDQYNLSFITLKEHELAIIVDDKGMPFDTEKAQNGEMDCLGFKLMRAFSNELHFINRGRKGKRVLMIVSLPARYSETLFPLRDKNIKHEVVTNTSQYEIKVVAPEMAEEIPRCVFRAYGYDYYDELMYRSKELYSLLLSGKMVSVMALTELGTAVGNMSVILDEPTSRTGLLGRAIIVPTLSSANVASKLTTFLTEKCRQEGLLGINIYMATSHPYEQIVYASLGAVNTGIMLGYLPSLKISEMIQDELKQSKRQTIITAYLRLNEELSTTVYLPSNYVDILKKIYMEVGLIRELKTISAEDEKILPAISTAVVTKNYSLGFAKINIVEIGDDIVNIVGIKLEELYQESIACIYLDLPLSQPAILKISILLEKYKFIFSSLIPETEYGDMLRLQNINFNIDISNIHIESNLGKEIIKKIVYERSKYYQFG